MRDPLIEQVVQLGQQRGLAAAPESFAHQDREALAPQRTMPFLSRHELANELDNALSPVVPATADWHEGQTSRCEVATVPRAPEIATTTRSSVVTVVGPPRPLDCGQPCQDFVTRATALPRFTGLRDPAPNGGPRLGASRERSASDRFQSLRRLPYVITSAPRWWSGISRPRHLMFARFRPARHADRRARG